GLSPIDLEQRYTEVVVRLRETRLNGECNAEGFDRFLHAAKITQHHAQVGVRVRMTGVESERGAKAFFCFAEFAGPLQQTTKIAMRVGKFWVLLEHSAVTRFRVDQTPRIPQRVAEVAEQNRVRGPVPGRGLHRLSRSIEAPRLIEQSAKRVQCFD